MVKLHLAAAVSVLALAGASVANASATSGSVWINQSSDSAATIPTTTPDATFSPGAINYSSSGGYTIGAFLNNPTFSNESAAFIAAGGSNASLNGNTFIDITGTVGLKSGANTFVVGHDDGVVLNITGFGTVVNAPGPTAFSTSPFTVTNPGPAGNFAFNLQYVECCGPPAALDFTINNVTVGVPEPATWSMMILGLGLLGATLRRRQAVAV